MSTCILVVGPPRTGSSIVAGTLHRLGAFCGFDLMPPDEWNPRGHYSDREISRFLCDWLGETSCPLVGSVSMTADQMSTAERIVSERMSHDLWVAKWFQSAHLIPALQSTGCDFKIIRCTRDRDRSIQSLMARIYDSEPHRSEIESWVDQSESAAIAVSNQYHDRSITFNFDDMIDSPEAFCDSLAEFCGLGKVASAYGWITPNLRRF